MMKRISLLVVILNCFLITLNGQAPGYLGKKASILFNFSSFPAIVGPTQNNRGSNDKVFGNGSGNIGINYEFEGHLAYATGRYTSFDIFVGQYYTGATSNATTQSLVPDPNDFYSDTDNHYLFHRLNVKSVGITYSNFIKGKGALAPIGNRFFMSLKHCFITSEIIDKKTEYSRELGEVIGHDNLNIDDKFALNFFHMGYSNKQVFWHKMIFNVGVRVGFPINLKYYNMYFEGDTRYHPDENISANQADYEYSVFDRLFRHELFRVDIGIGYLLF